MKLINLIISIAIVLVVLLILILFVKDVPSIVGESLENLKTWLGV